MPYPVIECVCFDRTFAELKKIAEEKGLKTIEELQEHVDFGLHCQMCVPYIQRMLKTGQTAFSPFFDPRSED